MSEKDTEFGLRELSPSQLVAWAEDNTQVMRLRTVRDVIPGGYTAALAPALVDWRASDLESDTPYVVLRNVNYGGNPLEKTTILQSARVPLGGIEFAEFTLVPSTRGGLLAPAHHAQLRFVFEPGREPELLNLAGAETGTDATIPDLILSWESWRAPDERFSLVRGLGAASFSLSLRIYAGPQRFLEDTLRGRDWFSYRLRMPGGSEGLTELLQVGLALGDGVARRTISGLLERGEEDWLRHAPAGEAENPGRQWQMLQERARASGVPDDPLLHLPTEKQSYQSLLRSCATLSRYTVLATVKRMVERGHTDGVNAEKLPAPVLGEPERWMEEVARSDLLGIFVRAPLALRYILRHPESVPANIPEELDAAGLLKRRGSQPWLIQYSREGTRPYGRHGVNRVQ